MLFDKLAIMHLLMHLFLQQRYTRNYYNLNVKISIHDFKAETKPVVKDARTNLLDEIAKGKQLKVKNSKLLMNFQFNIFLENCD